MAERPKTIEVLPSPKRLVESLRHVGYDFPGAVADLVDNSIAAYATVVDIKVEWHEADTWLRISDNGTGMDSAAITEALRFGAERSYKPDDLGKFGLGLKTASLSQCRQIYVASRTSDKIAKIDARRFDLDRIIADDRWEVEILSPADCPYELVSPLKAHAGTVVLWRGIDRMFGSRLPKGDRAEAVLWNNVERLERHLGMVFHRFLEGGLPGKKRDPLGINLNGNNVHSWNPFAPSEEFTQRLKARDFDISSSGVSGVVVLEPYILPPQAKFSSEAEFNRLSGPNKWNAQQGFYIYRANRMIQSGGWSRMRAADEHSKLARVALDFFPELDHAFGIDIAKMRVILPAQLRERIKVPIEDLVREAKRVYSAKSDQVKTANSGATVVPRRHVAPAPRPVVLPPPAKPTAVDTPLSPVPSSSGQVISWPPPPLRRTSGDALRDAAEQTGDTAALDRIASKLRELSPEVADDLGW